MKMATDMLSAFDQGKLVYSKRLDKLYQEFLSSHPPVFGSPYCSYDAPHGRVQFLSYSNLWRAIFKFEYKGRTEKRGPFFHG